MDPLPAAPVLGFSPVPADASHGSTLAALRTDVLGSPTAAAGQRTPGSSAKARQLVYLGQLYSQEVVGRKCSVLHNRHGKQGFEKAAILDFDPRSGQHKLRHSVDRVEEWLSLAEIKFKWVQTAPPEAAPNPTFKPELGGEAAVGKRLRVYWPAMQKWYCGTVRGYDPVTGLHTIFYKDGDQQALMLRHEPVIWADDEVAMAADSNPLIAWVPANSGSEAWSAGATAAGTGGSTPRHASNTGGAAAGVGAVLTMQPPPPPAAAALGGMIPVAATGAAAAGGVRQGGGGGPAALNVLGGSSRPASAAGRTAATPSPAAGGVAGGLVPGRSPALVAAAAASMHTAILRTVFPPTPPGRGKGRAQRGAAGGRGALGKHGRGDGGSADGTSKRRKGPGGQKLRHAALAAAAATAIPHKHLAVGSRVGVYWRLDKAFYTGKLKSYSAQTGKFTLQYDDGQCEQLLLERERFVWHTPRGMTAGYKPALHTLMQQLGAEGLKALPQEGPDGKLLPITPRPEGATHPPSTGAGAVGWRVQLYWPADGIWHEAEVLCYNESKRLHHVLYLDGEEEWLDLSNEMVVWARAMRNTALSAGHFLSSDEVPKGRDALGWHVAVYWKDDKQFYQGQVVDYDASAGKHKVLYHDGEEEFLTLRAERVIWRMPPSEVSEDGDDDMLLEEQLAHLDSDDSLDVMEAEETDDMTDDDTPVARKKGGSAPKRIRKKLRTRKSRVFRLGFESDNSSEPGRLMRQQGTSMWGGGSGHPGGSYTHTDTQPCGPFGSPMEPAAASTTLAAAAGSAFGHLGGPRAAAGEARGKGVVSRQLSTQPSGNGLFGGPLQATGGSMRAPLAPPGAAAVGAVGGSGSGLQARGVVAGGGLARASSSGLLGVSGSALLSLNLPAINIRRSGPSGDGCGSPLIRTSLDQIQLSVRITAGGNAAGTAAGTAAGGGGSVAPAANGPTAATAAGSGSLAGAAAATAAALQPVLQHLAPGRRQAAVRLQGKLDRLDMILSKLTATANMYGWRLETQEALPPLLPPLPAAARVKAGGAGHRSRSQPTSPTGVGGGGGRPGMGSPRHSSGPLSPRAAAAAAAAAARASNTGGSLPTSPRGTVLGPISPTAAAAAAAPGRTVAVHKTCAVKSRPGGAGNPTGSTSSGPQRLKAWPYGPLAAANNPPSSSSTGPQAGLGAGTAGGSGELTSVLAVAGPGPQQGASAQLAEAAVARQQQQQPAQQAAAAGASQQQQQPAAGGGSEPSLAASAARAAIEAMLTSGVHPMSMLQVNSNAAVPSVSRGADDVVTRLQVMAQAHSPHIQQQLQALQAAAASAAAAANAAAAAAAAAAVGGSAAPAPPPPAAAAAAGAERGAPLSKDPAVTKPAGVPSPQGQAPAAGCADSAAASGKQQAVGAAAKLAATGPAAKPAATGPGATAGQGAGKASAAAGPVAEQPKGLSKAAAALAAMGGAGGKAGGDGGKGSKVAGGRAGKQADNKK